MGDTRTDMTLAAVTASREAELAEARRAQRLRAMTGITEAEARELLAAWLERWPALAAWLERWPALGERRVLPSSLGSDRLRRRARVTR